MHTRSFYLNSEGKIERDLSSERLKQAHDDKEGLLWLDIYDPEFESAPFLIDEMGFHPLAVEDAMGRQHQPAKADDFGSHLFVILHGIDYSSEKDYVETARLSMFVEEGTVVTVHRVDLISVDAVADRIERDVRLMERPSSLFAYTILDSLHDAILPALDHLAEVAASLEEASIDSPAKEVLQSILQLKRSTIRIQRTMAPQIRVFNRLSRNEFPLIGEQASVYFRDLQDQSIQLEILNQGVRDTADNALATYLSSIGIKQNETMRVLAIVAAVFLPLSLLAGIYGMNFERIPELEWEWGYFAVIGIMWTVGLTTFYWLFLRRLNWSVKRGAEIMSSMKPPKEAMDRMMSPVRPTKEAVNRMMSPVNTVLDASETMARNITGTVTERIDRINERKPR